MYQKTILIARQTKNSQVIRISINNHIQRRYDNFNNNTTKMINSILSRHSEPVDLSRIILMDSVITDKNDIKLEVKNHFKNWTKLNSTSSLLWQQWKTEYEPKENINSSWYKDILEPVNLEELKQTISQALKQNATGPILISNEMLMHLSDKGLKAFLEIINTCF